MATMRLHTSLSCEETAGSAGSSLRWKGREERPSGSTHPSGNKSEQISYSAEEECSEHSPKTTHMWNESATRARLPTAVPTPNSSKRKAVSTVGQCGVSKGLRRL